ncbi:alpha/beta hydrolase [Arenibacter sp. F26102]|uniref:alpha/beta hydrolase n=1 Tax=Arenibacter sp. F26102 TaxID=2926416 RepID=UPI001FF2AD50|nr:alpha/beta hydrolase [Arenibacter sp. F26102]MCK0145360.1 alpha/beta hydrolase [Arenibacter sp. F26102]
MINSKIVLQIHSKIMFKFIVMLFVGIIFTSCSDDDNNPISKSPVVLVHGSWQADFVWEQTKKNLTAEGYQVSVVNLPGHGEDTTPASQIEFIDYVNTVKEAVNSYNQPVILVGHSLGGAVITQLASEIPNKISKLVYVAGYIPVSGKSVLDYAMLDAGSLLGPALQDEPAADGTLGLSNPEADLTNIFCQDGTGAQKQLLLDNYRAEPFAAFLYPLDYQSADYNKAGKKYYIFTTEDHAISYPFQQEMVATSGITNTYSMNTGHSPFISRSTEFTNNLISISED